ncbi:MAG: DUF3793 family protein [Bacillota bacterium]
MTQVERRIGYQCGLAMVGIKAGSLVAFKHKDYKDLMAELDFLRLRLQSVGIEMKVVFDNGERMLVMVYREKVLAKSLASAETRLFLAQYGYRYGADAKEMLECLSKRFHSADEFPHEIGVFLGYPLADIKGFIADPHGYKHCGVWKVYHNVEECKKLFTTYKKCASRIRCRIESGDDLTMIFKRAV